MKAMVVYDSQYGNTAKVAQTIGQALEGSAEVTVVKVGTVDPEQLRGLDLLVVGSPTQKFSPTGATKDFLKSIPRGALDGVRIAAFDTRFTPEEIEKVGILAFFVRLFGYAAEPMASRLQKKGGNLVAPPQWFYVAGTEGPLLEGELERAAEWATEIAAA
ncbi:MAG: flavodoxin domain-containing protein [Anaerolineae bacterium]|nr:flavodoxin domain-containing protein [Anaerolineae bacterium]